MKQFLRIFCLYLFALSCIPCNDGAHEHGQGNVETQTEISTTTDEHGCPPHEHCKDFCSPLCSCNCCSAIVTFQKTEVLSIRKALATKEKHSFPQNVSLVKDMAFAIDHPPQLS